MGKLSRSKGKRGEYEMRDFLRKWFPDARRGANQSRSGSDSADVEGTPFWTEAKLGAKPNVRAALEQAAVAADAHAEDRPVLVYIRDDFSDPFFAMPAATLTFLLDAAYGEHNSGTLAEVFRDDK